MSRVKLTFDAQDKQQVADALAQVLGIAARHRIRIDEGIHHTVRLEHTTLHAVLLDHVEEGTCHVIKTGEVPAPRQASAPQVAPDGTPSPF
jgi:hypothetical protein